MIETCKHNYAVAAGVKRGLLRLLENVLTVGEDPRNLVVYAALGKAARDWEIPRRDC